MRLQQKIVVAPNIVYNQIPQTKRERLTMEHRYKLIPNTGDSHVFEKVTRIKRPTFLRYVDKMELGDLEEQLGFSSHHTLGETITKNSNVSYYKAVYKNGETRKNAVIMSYKGENFVFLSTKRIKGSAPSKPETEDNLSEKEIIDSIVSTMESWDKEKLNAYFSQFKKQYMGTNND